MIRTVQLKRAPIGLFLASICFWSCGAKKYVLIEKADNETNPHLLYESDPITNYLTYQGFVVDFNSEKKVPNYTVHRIEPLQLKDSNGIAASRKKSPDFSVDKRIAESSGTKKDYYKSGFDRGHHVPAGDFVYSQQLKDETFTYANVSPQLKELNRYGWRYLEAAIRDKVIKCNCSAYVISGAYFNKGFKTIGTNQVGVPAALYKVVFYPDLAKIYAFRMENNTAFYQKPMKNYQLTVDELEALSGYDFFERLEDKIEEKLESKLLIFK